MTSAEGEALTRLGMLAKERRGGKLGQKDPKKGKKGKKPKPKKKKAKKKKVGDGKTMDFKTIDSRKGVMTIAEEEQENFENSENEVQLYLN